MNKEKLEEKYVKQFKHLLPFHLKDKDRILSTVQNGVHDYIVDHDTIDYETLISGFGTPQEIIDNYLEESPSIIRCSKNKTLLFVTILSFALTLCICLALAYFYYEQTPAYIYEEKPVEIDSFPNFEED